MYDPNTRLKIQIAVLNAKVRLLSEMVRKDLVSKEEFAPVKLIAYGFAAVVISSVLAAVLSYVLRHAQ
jgi:hypothetical protein